MIPHPTDPEDDDWYRFPRPARDLWFGDATPTQRLYWGLFSSCGLVARPCNWVRDNGEAARAAFNAKLNNKSRD